MEPFGLLPGFVKHIVVKAVSGFRGIMKRIREKPNAGSMPRELYLREKLGWIRTIAHSVWKDEEANPDALRILFV